MPGRYRDRREGGRELVRNLARWRNHPDTLVLALPRGGVPVGWEVARALHAPLDIFLVRKLGVPSQEELAMGAIATGGVRVLNPAIVGPLDIDRATIERVVAREQQELKRREREYRGNRPAPEVRGKVVMLVDDGLATGSTMRAAVRALRQQQPAWIVVAAPVGAAPACAVLRDEADEVVCAMTPEPFLALGHWYEELDEVSDDEVRELLCPTHAPGSVAQAAEETPA